MRLTFLYFVLQLRNEFSLCRVYVKTATIQSSDRRPINPISNENRQITTEVSTSNTNVSTLLQQTESTRSSFSGDRSSDLLVSVETLDWSSLDELGLDINWF